MHSRVGGYSGGCRTPFRDEAERDSGIAPKQARQLPCRGEPFGGDVEFQFAR